jgi:transcriptional regulator with XRE-family HTH domain
MPEFSEVSGMPAVADMTFAERLRAARKAAGLSQGQLAAATGLSVSLIAQMEQGHTADPKMSTLLLLGKALGVTVSELAGDAPRGEL